MGWYILCLGKLNGITARVASNGNQQTYIHAYESTVMYTVHGLGAFTHSLYDIVNAIIYAKERERKRKREQTSFM